MDAADVRSISVLREWSAALDTYRSEANESLGAARMEIRRGEDWLQVQLNLWQKAVRDLEEAVHKAKMDLAAKKTPGPTGRMPDTTLEEKALRRARAKQEFAEDKVRTCKAWIVQLPRAVDECFTGPMHRLQSFLDVDLERAKAVLGRQAEALEQYSDLKPNFGGGKS